MENSIIKNIGKRLYNTYNSTQKKRVTYNDISNRLHSFICNAPLYNNIHLFDKLCCKTATVNECVWFVDNVLFDKLNEGYKNPFYYDDAISDMNNDDDNEKDIPVDDNIEIKDIDGGYIKAVRLWDTNVNGKIMCKNGKMYAGILFTSNDIVEECPIKELDDVDMYSRNIRDISFELVPNSNRYGIPYGYANVYATSVDRKCEGNIDYEYIPENNFIRFYAIRTIKPNEELILRVSDDIVS